MAIDKNISILIVDDYKTILRIIRDFLSQLGFNNVEEATNGSMALTKLKEKDFSLIISDRDMEPMNGIELLRKIRDDEKTKEVKFIIVTAENKPANITIAKEAGANAHILKPFNLAALKQTLINVLGEFE